MNPADELEPRDFTPEEAVEFSRVLKSARSNILGEAVPVIAEEGCDAREGPFLCRVDYHHDTDDGVDAWLAFATDLPGCATWDETRELAEKQIKDALVGTLESYILERQPIPWEDGKWHECEVHETGTVIVTVPDLTEDWLRRTQFSLLIDSRVVTPYGWEWLDECF